MSAILVVDDEAAICWSLAERLRDAGHEVRTAASIPKALRALDGFRPDVVALDVRLPGTDGLSALPKLRERLGAAPVVVMTAFGDLETAARAFAADAFEYVVKPFDLEEMAATLDRAMAARPAASAEPPAADASLMAGRSPAMQQVFRQLALAATSPLPALLLGETGTGKELAARALHDLGPRARGPFVSVCVAALNPALVESELFGHVRGAFTGATERRQGVFERAAGGTIFLDEIGDTPPALQVKLLRVLETGRAAPVGSDEERPVAARVVAATNRDLAAAVADGTFRADLLYRLGGFAITLPPLRARRDDIAALAERFLRNAFGAAAPPLTPAFVAALDAHPWPGNVRELKHAVEYAAVLARGQPLRPEHLPPGLSAGPAGEPTAALKSALARWAENQLAPADAENVHRALLAVAEPLLFQQALERHGGNRTAAAKALGIDRATLRTRLKLDDDRPAGK